MVHGLIDHPGNHQTWEATCANGERLRTLGGPVTCTRAEIEGIGDR